MTDRLQRASDRVHLARARLQRLGARDLADSCAPRGQSYEVAVSGSEGSSVPEASVTSGTLAQARVAQQATRLMEKAASLMERGVEQLTYTPTSASGRCATETDGVRCTGEATHGRLCEICDGDWRTRRGVDIPVQVIKARNAKRTLKCQCHREHDHQPGVCVRDLEPGQTAGRCKVCREAEAAPTCRDCGGQPSEGRTLCNRCRSRRRPERQDDGAHPFAWNAPR